MTQPKVLTIVQHFCCDKSENNQTCCCPHAWLLAVDHIFNMILHTAVSAYGCNLNLGSRAWRFRHADLLHLVTLQLVADKYNINPAPHYAIFNGLLLFLFGLHLYWYAAFHNTCTAAYMYKLCSIGITFSTCSIHAVATSCTNGTAAWLSCDTRSLSPQSW